MKSPARGDPGHRRDERARIAGQLVGDRRGGADAHGYERTYKSNNRTVHEHWIRTSGQNAMDYGEYDVIVGQRYIVNASGQVAAIDTLRSAVESMDLARLESLRKRRQPTEVGKCPRQGQC
jgi:hypothetical protein